MGKSLGSITGSKEKITDVTAKSVTYVSSTLHIGTFYGGLMRGKSLQLSIGDEYVQLSKEQALDLIHRLEEAFK